MKPIFFKTEMVEAILEGRKTVTRRLVKIGDRTPLSIERPKFYKMVKKLNGKPFFGAGFYKDSDIFNVDGKTHIDARYFKAPFRPGEVLYVREAWQREYDGSYAYRAGQTFEAEKGWRPSIHMPKEAARIFLRVTEVRAERLQDIDYEGCKAEGIWDDYKTLSKKYHENLARSAYPVAFAELWDSTIKKSDLPRYGWKANPWVWVVSFERISKEEAMEEENNA